MPTSPPAPISNSAIDRLTLNVTCLRGAAVVAAIGSYSTCLEVEGSMIGGLSQVCACFEARGSGIGGLDVCSADACYCAEDQ